VMDIGCQIQYRAADRQRPRYTGGYGYSSSCCCSSYGQRPEGCVSSSKLPPAGSFNEVDEEGRLIRVLRPRCGQSVEGMAIDGGGACMTAWVFSGRPNVFQTDTDIPRSASYHARTERRREITPNHDGDVLPLSYCLRQSNDSSRCVGFDRPVHGGRTPAAEVLNVVDHPSSFHAAASHVPAVEPQYGGAHPAMMTTTGSSPQFHRRTMPRPHPPPSSTYNLPQHSNYIPPQHRLHRDRSPPPDHLGRPDVLGQLNGASNYNDTSSSLKSGGSPPSRYGAYVIPNGQHETSARTDTAFNVAAEHTEVRDKVSRASGSQGRGNGAALAREESSTGLTVLASSSQSTSNGGSVSSRLSAPTSAAAVVMSPPCLEAHQLSLTTAAGLPSVSKTPPRRSVSSSQSSSSSSSSLSSSTPNVIRRHLKTFAHSIDSRLAAALGGAPAVHHPSKSRTSQGHPHRKPPPPRTLVRSNSDPEALDRVQSGDEFGGLNVSCPPSYGVKAVPASPTVRIPADSYVKHAPLNQLANESRGQHVEETSSSMHAAFKSATSMTTTKFGPPATLMHKDNTLPKVCINMRLIKKVCWCFVSIHNFSNNFQTCNV